MKQREHLTLDSDMGALKLKSKFLTTQFISSIMYFLGISYSRIELKDSVEENYWVYETAGEAEED